MKVKHLPGGVHPECEVSALLCPNSLAQSALPISKVRGQSQLQGGDEFSDKGRNRRVFSQGVHECEQRRPQEYHHEQNHHDVELTVATLPLSFLRPVMAPLRITLVAPQ